MILLTTPFDPGDVDPGKSYTHVSIVGFGISFTGTAITVRCKYGYLDGANFVSGKVKSAAHVARDAPAVVDPVTGNVIKPAETEFTFLTSQPGSTGSSIYQQAGAALYQWLIAQGFYAGTVVA